MADVFTAFFPHGIDEHRFYLRRLLGILHRTREMPPGLCLFARVMDMLTEAREG